MSLGYAEKLSYREDIGKVGMPELYDTPHEVQSKIEELAKLIQQSRHLVVFTGAGISTSCGIPDFRGPKGIWTLQHEGKPLPRAEVAFHQAKPGLTHMALVGLQQAGILKFVISQNIDGLHLKSGIPRHLLSELHGNSFREVCSSCGKEFVRDFEVETIGLKETGRRCTSFKCRGKLKDTVLDWEDALPASELTPAENHCSEADVVLCLGTSLQITPACNLPLRSVRAGGKMVIVNLQATPKDKKASLLIRARVDEVIAGVLEILKIKIPPYLHIKYIVVRACFPCKKKNRRIKWSLRVGSVHGQKATLPFIKSVEISFPDRPDMKSALLNQEPFVLQRDNLKFTTLDVHLKLELQEDTSTCSYVEIHQSYNVEEFKDDETNNERKAAIVEKLRAEAVEGGIFGRALPIDSLQQRESKEIIVEYVFVTGITKYCMPFEEKKIPRISFENGSCDDEAMVKKPKLESTVIKEDVDRSEDRANGSLEDLKSSIHLDLVVPQSV